MDSKAPLTESLSPAFLQELSGQIGPIDEVPELEELLVYSKYYLGEPRQGAAMVGIAKKFSDLGSRHKELEHPAQLIYQDTLLFIYHKVEDCASNVYYCFPRGNIVRAEAAEPCEATSNILFDKTVERPLVMRLSCSRGKETERRVIVPLSFNLAQYGTFSRDALAATHYSLTMPNVPQDKRLEYFVFYAFRMGLGMSPEEASAQRFQDVQGAFLNTN